MKVFEPLHVGGVVIEELDVRSMSDEDIVRLNAFTNLLLAESTPEDPPRPIELARANIRNIPDFVVVRFFVGRESSGDVVAAAEASWTATDENTHLVWTGIRVHPEYRRLGIATALLRRVADLADDEGRTMLMAGSSERVPAGEAFAKRIGAEAGQAVHTNRLGFEDVDGELVRSWVDAGPGRAPGYSLLAVDGPYPDDLAEAIVDVVNMMNTAPRDDLAIEDEQYTVDQARQHEKRMIASSSERWSLFARHDATGILAGFTEVMWNPSHPNTVWQMGTAVRPEHRGHALGKWLKAVMLQRVLDERSGVEEIRTGNADSNDAMLGINRQLGFKPYIAGTQWQVEVDRVRAYLAERP